MKAITIWQPWASLLACGAKKYETRSWATKYRGPIAIHAARKDPCKLPIEEALEKATWEEINAGRCPRWCDMPWGRIIATAELVNVWRIIRNPGQDFAEGAHKIGAEDQQGNYIIPSEMELAFGDWTPGRYAWEFSDMKMISPVPVSGKQGLWNWNVK